jgi:triphosphoribosyl-dephospho-CoA synthase
VGGGPTLTVTAGINAHRGAIFGLGILCAAAGAVAEISTGGVAVAPVRLGEVVMRRWGAEIRRGPIPLFSHGAAALWRGRRPVRGGGRVSQRL